MHMNVVQCVCMCMWVTMYMSVCVLRLYVALHHLTGAKPCGMALLYLTLGWTYTAHQRCNKSIPHCQNLSESFCACEQHIFRFPHLRADVCLTHGHTQMKCSLTQKRVTKGERESGIRKECVDKSAVCVCVCVCGCTYVSLWSIRVSMASLEWLIRGEVEESVRVSGWLRWRVLEPFLFLCWHLLTSVYHLSHSHTPLLLTLATPQLSKDPRRIHYSDCPCEESLGARREERII